MFKDRKRSAVEFYEDQTKFLNKKELKVAKQLEEKNREIERLKNELEQAKRSKRQSTERMKKIKPAQYEQYLHV